jgi:hypothetical protein
MGDILEIPLEYQGLDQNGVLIRLCIQCERMNGTLERIQLDLLKLQAFQEKREPLLNVLETHPEKLEKFQRIYYISIGVMITLQALGLGGIMLGRLRDWGFL